MAALAVQSRRIPPPDPNFGAKVMVRQMGVVSSQRWLLTDRLSSDGYVGRRYRFPGEDGLATRSTSHLLISRRALS